MATKVAVVNQGELTLFCTDWFHASMHRKIRMSQELEEKMHSDLFRQVNWIKSLSIAITLK